MTQDAILLTVFLRHDQSNNLDAVQTKLRDADWWERFPPEGVDIVSWIVAMGFGQIVTLRVLPDRLADVNRCGQDLFNDGCHISSAYLNAAIIT